MRLVLRVRRFCCSNSACPKKTFAEQFPEWLPAYARCTTRLNTLICQIGFEVGGEAGRRILQYFKVITSGDTLIRRVRQTPSTMSTISRVIGVDDWAFKKGRNYGTIIVDLEKHRVIDLLADRTATILAEWLQAHPGIEIVARDRSAEYAAGIQAGCPQALQVADRWHLMVNLRQMLQRFLGSDTSRLSPLTIPPGKAHLFPSQRKAFRRTKAEQLQSQTSRERRVARYERIQELRRDGFNISQITRHLGLHHETVRKNFYATSFPERKQRQTTFSILDPYLAYLEKRFQNGCENGMQLWREIQSMGYPGSHRQVLRWLQLHRTKPAPSTPKKHLPTLSLHKPAAPDTWKLPSVKQLSWLLVKEPQNLTEQETIILAHLHSDPDIARLYPLAQQFLTMIRNQQANIFDIWLEAAINTGIVQLYNFAFGLQQDYSAIRAALETPWSNGQTEGQVNRLKFIKRQMYGRAHFDLLRLRVLYSANST